MATANVVHDKGTLTVRFIRDFPREDVVYLAHRCAKELSLTCPLTVVVEATRAAPDRAYHVRVETGTGARGVSTPGLELLDAVRDAFAHLQAPSLH